MTDINYVQSVILGIVEGVTEYLPISSTGHLNLTEKVLGLGLKDPVVTAYTAIIQVPAIIATIIYFWRDIVRLASAWFAGLRDAGRRTDHDYALAWAVIVGSIPVALVGYAARHVIEGPLRSLWVFAAALIVWSVVIVLAETRHAKLVRDGAERGEGDITVADGLKIGLVQCVSPIPGVSRSGATISAGLFLGLNRVTATRMSFFLAIPALTAAGAFEMATTDFTGVQLGPLVVGCLVSFAVAYASIAWLLRFVATNTLIPFVWYRVALGVVLVGLLATGALAAS